MGGSCQQIPLIPSFIRGTIESFGQLLYESSKLVWRGFFSPTSHTLSGFCILPSSVVKVIENWVDTSPLQPLSSHFHLRLNQMGLLSLGRSLMLPEYLCYMRDILQVRQVKRGEMQGKEIILAALNVATSPLELTPNWGKIYYSYSMSTRPINSLIIVLCLIKRFPSSSMGVIQISRWKGSNFSFAR